MQPATRADARDQLVALIPRLRRFGHALTGSRDEGDDVAQAALERALTRLDQWEPGTRLDSWVFRIAQNFWFDELRSRRRRDHVGDDTVLAALPGEDGRQSHADRVMLAQTRAAAATLPPDQRAVLALVTVEGLSYQEASDTLGVPIGTVMSRLARARRALADRLGERS